MGYDPHRVQSGTSDARQVDWRRAVEHDNQNEKPAWPFTCYSHLRSRPGATVSLPLRHIGCVVGMYMLQYFHWNDQCDITYVQFVTFCNAAEFCDSACRVLGVCYQQVPASWLQIVVPWRQECRNKIFSCSSGLRDREPSVLRHTSCARLEEGQMTWKGISPSRSCAGLRCKRLAGGPPPTS